MVQLHPDPSAGFATAVTPRVELADLGKPWAERAACAGQWKLFDAVDEALRPRGKMSKARRIKLDTIIGQARALCASCPVFAQCEASVKPPLISGDDGTYSLIAGRDHRQFQAGGYQPPMPPVPQEKAQCPMCPRTVAKRQLHRHIAAHNSAVEWKHGTVSGYHRHRAHREAACVPCKEAMSRKSQARRAMIAARARMHDAAQEALVPGGRVALTP